MRGMGWEERYEATIFAQFVARERTRLNEVETLSNGKQCGLIDCISDVFRIE